MATLKARKAFKDANTAYQAGDYKKAPRTTRRRCGNAATRHQRVSRPEADRRLLLPRQQLRQHAKLSRKGEAENDANLTKAVEHYKKSAGDREGAAHPPARARRSGGGAVSPTS
jgi:hypothetical protein